MCFIDCTLGNGQPFCQVDPSSGFLNRNSFFNSRKAICQLAMNYPVPHYKKNKTVRDSTLEDLCYVDLHHIICRPPFQYKLESNFEDDFEMQGAAYTAFPSCPPKAVLPFPLFLPVPVCCGRGM